MKTPDYTVEPCPIYLLVNIPDGPLAVAAGVPAHNQMGMYLAFEVVTQDLRLNGIIFETPRHTGTLNDCTIAFEVFDVPKALRVIQATLTRCQLWDFTTVYFSNDTQTVMHTHHYGLGIQSPFNPAEIKARNARHMAAHNARRDAIKRLVDSLPAPTQPPDQDSH